MKKELEHKITLEQIQALLEGKKLVLDYMGFPRITIYPPKYGIFLTYEEYESLRRCLTPEEQARLDFIKSPNPLT